MATAIGTDTDQENFFRMSILIVDYAVKILQDVLQQELRKKYPNLFDPSTGLLCGVLGDAAVKAKLDRLVLLRVLNVHQQNQLYSAGNPSPSVTVGDLDITLTVLLLRNITTLNPRPGLNAWDDPSDTDTSTEATIGRVKRYRNVVYGHANKAAITEQDFRGHFSGLKSNLQVLSSMYTNEEYDAILSKPLDSALLERNQSILKEWYYYDKNVKDELVSMKATMEEEIPSLRSHIEQIQKSSEDTVIREMRSETQKTHDKLEKIGLVLEQNVQMTEDMQGQLQVIYDRDRDRPESQKISEIQELRIEVIYDRDRDRPESQKIPGKHVTQDDSSDKSEVHPVKGSKLHTTKPDPHYQTPVMSPTHKNLLFQKRRLLIENLQAEEIIPDMVARGILTERNAEKVMAHKTEQEQAFEFLRILPKCGLRAFDTFVEVLREHNKKELADFLAEKATTCSSKNQIATFYINHMSQIQRLPWDPNDTMHMDDVYVNLQWVQEKSKSKEASSTSVESYTAIFENIRQGKRPKRILVRGKAGIGKTTFTQKMATDWANDAKGLKKCEQVLSKYEHLIILNLRSIQPGQTLKEAIGIQIPCSAENMKAVAEETMQTLDNNREHVLLVFDGYDEYDPNTSQEITDVIKRRRYQDVCTIITTRPWKAEKLMNRRIMDSVYEITGLTEDNVAQYVANFFDEKEAYDEYKKYSFMPFRESEKYNYQKSFELLHRIGQGLLGYLLRMRLMSLAKTPILLLFICLMWEDQKSDSSTGSLPDSYTLLYERIIELLIRRRYNIRTKNEVKKYLGKLEQSFFNLGKLALEGLLKSVGGLVFDEEDLQSIPNMSELYSLGLLSRSKVHCNLDVKHEVTFLHKTIQELFAAKYLSRTIDGNKNVLDNFLGLLNTIDRLYDMEYVLLFLCGLSKQPTANLQPRFQELVEMDASLKQIYSSKSEIDTIFIRDKLYFESNYPFDCNIVDQYIGHFNNLLLEHWYAHCPQERDLTPELAPWHTILHIPQSFTHSDTGFQEILENSLSSSEQAWKSVFQDVNAIIFDGTKLTACEDKRDPNPNMNGAAEHLILKILMTCQIFKNLTSVICVGISFITPYCKGVLKHVLYNAPNLNTIYFDSSKLDSSSLSVQNPAKLCNLFLKNVSEVDLVTLRQMTVLKLVYLENIRPNDRSMETKLGELPIFSHGLTSIVIRNDNLTAEDIKLLGRNLHHVQGLEHLALEMVYRWKHDTFLAILILDDVFKPCSCIDQQEEDHDCPDLCEAILELSHGVTHTPKLKYFSLESNGLGRYCGVTSPLTVLVQSLCTLSEQTAIEIDLSYNFLENVEGLKELIQSTASSYQHVTVTLHDHW